ncbi:cholesterol esterase [Streptomyces sp. KM273126]|uniref:DUF6230 family protein n=1 Tax=Streptomyces sp. KM273126 TaxID=2545247 RepID=UPI00103BFB31|nr:DUF6230 family protein [Streptomyces sp. KM273126]MBA2809044.1 cholesterol esterase [Streptomyces sp. KM273126]
MESQVRGGTRWKRFAVVMVPSVAATAAIGVALAQGALAASFSVSGQSFKVTADRLDGTGFSQYGAIDQGYTLKGEKVARPVAVSAFTNATITNMCQSVVTPDIPLVGTVSLKLTAGTGSKKVEADNLYIDVEELSADAEFKDINIGVAAGDLKDGPGPGMKGGKEQSNPFGFGQQSRVATLTDVKQTAWATTAGTFKLSNLKMSLHKGANECY